MLILIYIAVLLIGLFVFLKFLAPELNLNLRLSSIKLPEMKLPSIGRPKLMGDVSSAFKVPARPAVELAQPMEIPLPVVHSYKQSNQVMEKTDKTEAMLTEKNKEIAELKEVLLARQRQCDEFDKVKEILDEEIVKLREQNRTLKSELLLQMPESPAINL